MTQSNDTNDANRLKLVAAAQRQWIDALTDLGGRNTLLYYKDRRAGTLDLAAAEIGQRVDPLPLRGGDQLEAVRVVRVVRLRHGRSCSRRTVSYPANGR